jgi:hypothetical protein
MFTRKSVLMRAVLGTAIAVAVAVSAFAADGPVISKASYKKDKNAIVIVGTGFDQSATVRLNGVELTGEKKFKAEKHKLRVTVPTGGTELKPDGENRIEVVQGEVSSGEFPF